MSPSVLNLILKALDAYGEAVFSREDIAAWPKGDFEEALRTGLLEKAAPAAEVVCPGCEEACLEDVEIIRGTKPEETRAYVVCGRGVTGRVPIALESLDRWAVNRKQANRLIGERRDRAGAQTSSLPGAATPDEGVLTAFFRERWEHDDNALIESYKLAAPSDLLADCNRMIGCLSGFDTIFLMSPAQAAQQSRGLDRAWLTGFTQTLEMLCLAAVSRRIDLEPFKEFAKAAYSFWTGSLPAQETEDAIKRFYHPCITALFNLKRALMVEVASAEEGTPEAEALPTARIAGQTESKEVPWQDDAPEFLPNSEAVKLADDGSLSLKKLGAILTPQGPMHYMRKGRRCKVHAAEYRMFLKSVKKAGGGAITDEAIETYLSGVEARKAAARTQKQAGR